MRRAIVTGGTRGIGHAIAQAILADGGRVMITGRSREHVDAAVRSLGEAAGDPSRVFGQVADVRDREAVEAMVADTSKRFGGLDVLVNNAGVGIFGDVVSTSDADWLRVIETNLSGPFYCSRAAIPEMKKSGGGWIINIASLAGRNAFAGGAAYCASKAALVSFSESLMLEVRYDDIRVAVVMPGSVATEFTMQPSETDASWKLTASDVAEVVIDLLRHPGRSLPSKVEIRPSKPKKK